MLEINKYAFFFFRAFIGKSIIWLKPYAFWWVSVAVRVKKLIKIFLYLSMERRRRQKRGAGWDGGGGGAVEVFLGG